MVSQHFQRVARHADEAEVLRGGMLLSYGMHREAGEVFARLIDKGAPPAGARPGLVLPGQDSLPARLSGGREGRARPHRQALARRTGRRTRAAAGQPADRPGRLRRRSEGVVRPRRYRPAAQGCRARYERRALRPLQPRRRADQERRCGAGQRAARPDWQRPGRATKNSAACAIAPTWRWALRRWRRSSPRRRATSSNGCA